MLNILFLINIINRTLTFARGPIYSNTCLSLAYTYYLSGYYVTCTTVPFLAVSFGRALDDFTETSVGY